MFFDKTPDFSKIQFGKPKKTTDGKYFVTMNLKNEDESSEHIFCQMLPKFECSKINETSLEAIIPTSSDVMQFVRDVDDHILTCCKDNKQEWFQSDEISDAYLEQAFMPTLKPIKKSQDHSMVFRLTKDIEIYDRSQQPLELSAVVKGSNIAIIYQIEGIWFTKSRFGVTFKARQLMVHQNAPTQKFGKCLFEDANEDFENVFPDE